MPTTEQLLTQLGAIAAKARQAARTKNFKKIYLHWTGGAFRPNAIDMKDYNLLVEGDGTYTVGGPGFDYPGAATFRRNTGSYAIALCCCLNAQCSPAGLPIKTMFPPTDIQVENMARAMAELTGAFGLALGGWDVMTHAEAADNLDGNATHGPYGPLSTCEKWDLWKLADYDGAVRNGGDVLRGKANWYRENGIGEGM